MRSLLGILLVAAGLSMAVLWMPSYDGERQLAVVTEIATQGVALVSVPQPTVPEVRTNRTFSPQAPLVPDAKSRQATAPVEAAPKATETAALTLSSMTVAAGPPAAAGMVATTRTLPSRPIDENGRLELVRNLQRELKRVGCYSGDADGEWGAASKRAMGSFTELVNASLPYDDPDYILLTLVQGHTGQACGKGCPTGQSMADGKCTPNAIVAQGARRVRPIAKPTTTESEQVRTVSSTIAPEGKRMQQAAAGAQTGPEAARTSPETTMATGAALAAAATVVAAAVIPGRMSVGASRVGEPEFTPKSDPTPATEAIRKSLPNTAGESAEQAEAREKEARDRERRKARAAAEREKERDRNERAAERERNERAAERERARVAAERERTKPRPAVQRDPPPPRQVVVVREPPRYRPPAVYFAPPQPRRFVSRSWTATFFDR